MIRTVFATWFILFIVTDASAEPPVASYIFPAGGQRGTTVQVRVGGLFLHKECNFHLIGRGVETAPKLERTKTLWFEGPLLPLPDSQQAEDYPKDMAGSIRIAQDAELGIRYWQVSTAQGATPAMKFVVGDLPEIVEQETAGDALPVEVKLPVTINGRIFPREDVDIWSFRAKQGESITCEVQAAKLGSPLDARLEVRDPHGRRIAEALAKTGGDPLLTFTAPLDGIYQVRIHDIAYRGGQAYVYRLTLTADPYVEYVFPLGGRRGSKSVFTVSGQGLPNQSMEIALPADGPKDYVHRLPVGAKLSNSVLLELDDLPEYLIAPSHHAQSISLPAIVNGRIERPGDADTWTFPLHKGESYEFDCHAQRLGSPLNAVLTLADAAGKELARVDGLDADPRLQFTAPADGTYMLRVAERFAGRGGPAFAYRLRIAKPPAADFRLMLAADALTLPRGGQAKLKITAERLGGFDGAINLTIDGLPPGVTVANGQIAAKQPAGEIVLKSDAQAAIQTSRLTIHGAAKIADREVTRTAAMLVSRGSPALDSVLLAVALPTPFKIVGDYDMRWAPRGTVHRRHYRVERGGFDGPLEISMADRQMRHVQGVSGPAITVPAGVSEFDYPVNLPPWMEMGRTCRICVMAVGVVKDADGKEHEVSFSSVNQNEQIVAVIEPGRLSITASRTSLAAVPGQTIAVPVRIGRGKGVAGPVKVELIIAEHIRGVAADAVEIPADKDSAVVRIRFDAGAVGPFNTPLLLRATTVVQSDPIVAETNLEVR
jgi:hypothetical protein